jgi:UDP-N-acetyl-2-amino-2-deoxyglucuronate dehydrogenase
LPSKFPMKSQLRILLLGCGHIGKRHAEIIDELAILAGVCDTDDGKAKAIGSQFSVPYYTDSRQMLDSVSADAVAVCTPNGLHSNHSIDSLSRSFHVLCEKPMALSSDDCRKVIEAAEFNNRHFSVVKQNRYNPPVSYLKRILDDGILGKVYSVQVNCFWNRDAGYYHNSWKGTRAMDGGVLFTQFSHFIDILYWMFGDIRKVCSAASNSGHRGITEFDDNGTACIEFLSGAIGGLHYSINTSEVNMEGSLTVIAEKGTVKIGGKYLDRLEYHHIPGIPEPTLPEGNRANKYGSYEGSMSNHRAVYTDFIESVSANRKSSNSFEALKAVEIIERIHKSALDQTIHI